MVIHPQSFNEDEIRKIAREVASTDRRVDPEDFAQEVLFSCLIACRIYEAMNRTITPGLFWRITRCRLAYEQRNLAKRIPTMSYDEITAMGVEPHDHRAECELQSVLQRNEMKAYLIKLDAKILAAIYLKAQGFTDEENAENLGITKDMLKKHFRELRKLTAKFGFIDPRSPYNPYPEGGVA